MLPRSRFTPYYVLFISLLLDIAGFLTSSAILWPYGSIVLTLLNGIAMSLLIYTASCIDPAMDELIEKRKNGFKPLPWSPSGGHVIEDQLCKICLIYAPKGTKHCRVCNVCVQDFDHHCIWLNRCIGAKNYKYFLILIASAVINAAIVAVYHLTMLAMWFAKSEHLAYVTTVDSVFIIELPLFSVYLYFWVGSSLAILIIAMFTFLPVMNLLLFHLRLVKNGKSTYTVIMEHRQKGQKKTNVSLTLPSLPEQTTGSASLNDVKVVGSKAAVVTPSSGRGQPVRDIPPAISLRVMEQESPRFRAPGGSPHIVSY